MTQKIKSLEAFSQNYIALLLYLELEVYRSDLCSYSIKSPSEYLFDRVISIA